MPAPLTRDYFAELYVAGLFGDTGWAVYFPKRDVGFDFIATKEVNGRILVRPVQVKGLYPTSTKGDKDGYGFSGDLTAVHPHMVLALPFFHAETRHSPEAVAFMPFACIRPRARGGFRCVPALFRMGHAKPRRDSAQFFGAEGLSRVESAEWDTGEHSIARED